MPATNETDVQVQDFAYETSSCSDAIVSSDEEVTAYFESPTSKSCGNPTNYSSTKKFATFESASNAEDHKEFIRKSAELLIKNAVFDGTNRKNKVLEFQTPDQLKKLFDFGIRSSPMAHDDLLRLLEDTVRYSVKTGHPYFANQLFSSLDPYGLVGQWLTDALNPSVYTYEVSPVFSLMEEVVLKEMRKIVGFKNGNGDGIFCPGGSMANGYAINCARYKYMPNIKVWILKVINKFI